MAQLQGELEALDRQIERNASDFVKLTELTQKREAARLALDEAEERWLYLTDLAERIEAQKKKLTARTYFPRRRISCMRHHERKRGKQTMKRSNKAMLAAGMLAGVCMLTGCASGGSAQPTPSPDVAQQQSAEPSPEASEEPAEEAPLSLTVDGRRSSLRPWRKTAG